jgi:hypothetical protein
MALKNVIDIIIRGHDKASKDFKKVEGRMAKMTNFVKAHAGIMATALATTVVVGLQQMVSSFVTATDQVVKFSDRIGVSTEFLSELGFVAKKTGVVVSQMQIGFQRATRRVSEFVQTGAGPAADVLADLEKRGVKLTRPGGGLKSIEELLPDLADYFVDLGDSTLKVRKAFQLFDSEGVSLVNILNLGSEGLAKMREEAVKYGVSIDKNMVEKAVKVKEATENMNAAMDGLKNEIVTGLSPAISNAAEKLTDFLVVVRKVDEAVGKSKLRDFPLPQPGESESDFLKRTQSGAPGKFDPNARAARFGGAGAAEAQSIEEQRAALKAEMLEWIRLRDEADRSGFADGGVGPMAVPNLVGFANEQIEAMERVNQKIAEQTVNLDLVYGSVNLISGAMTEWTSTVISGGNAFKIKFGDVAKRSLTDVIARINQAIARMIVFQAVSGLIPSSEGFLRKAFGMNPKIDGGGDNSPSQRARDVWNSSELRRARRDAEYATGM